MKHGFFKVSPCGASDFLGGQKVTKEPLGEFTGANFVRHVEFPQTPFYEGPN